MKLKSVFSRVLPLILVCCFLQISMAQTQVTGAFGIPFGTKYGKVSRSSADLSRFKVEPPMTSDMFDHYFVRLTPVSLEVHGIYAQKTWASEVQCKADNQRLRNILMDKYGEFRHRTTKADRLILEASDSYIHTNCASNDDETFSHEIFYSNKALFRRSVQERMQLLNANPF